MSENSNSAKGVRGLYDSTLTTSSGRDVHEQQVAPGRHPATACKSTTRRTSRTDTTTKVGTWNVQTMFQAGKLENIKLEMDRIGFNVLGLSETRWTGSNLCRSGNKTLIYSGGTKHERGVGILFNENTAKSLKGWWGVSDRVIVAKLESKPFDIGIIQVYAPTSTHEDEEVEKFYEDLDKGMKQLKSQDVKIVMGDFNAKVGNERNEDIVGPWGLGDINERGERLIDWCKENGLMVANTWYKNHARRRYTWISPGDRTRNQIDYILIQKRFRNSIKYAKSLPGADCGSDHVPVVCKMKVKLRKLKKAKLSPKFQVEFLKTNDEMRSKFRIDVRNRFEALESITETEELWDRMKNSINEAMIENIPKKPKRENKKWITEDILELMKERRQIKNVDEQKYKNLTKEIKKRCNEAKEKWLNDQCLEIQTKQNSDSRYIHEKIREVTGRKTCSNIGCIKSKDGNILMNKDDILNRWSEYIEELFSDKRNDPPIIKKKMDGPAILKVEVEAAIKKMKFGKSLGPDNIPIEVIVTMEDLGIEITTKLLNLIYDSGTIPDDLIKSIFITLPKSPGATECELHRTISLMSHITKLLLRVLMNRMRKSVRPEISRTQFGFVPDKGTRNAIFTLSMLMERCIEVQQDLFICFIDYSKAFDKVKHDELFKILENLDIDGKDLRIIRNLYWGQTAAVRVDNECSDFREIKRGVRQGCVMSPDLFNLYSEIILRHLNDIPGLKVNGENINNIRYADDTALIAGSEKDLQTLLDIVVKESENMGLFLNVKKTECMVVSKKVVNPNCNLKSKGEVIKQVKKFRYLGYMITSDGRCTAEIKRRIGMAKDSFNKMKPVLTNRNISMSTKIKVLKAYVWSTLLYGCECWTMNADLERRLEAAKMWFF